jgi:hypothetical protein
VGDLAVTQERIPGFNWRERWRDKERKKEREEKRREKERQRKREILFSLRIQETVLMIKHYKKCVSREKSIIFQNVKNGKKPWDGKYTAAQ